MSYPTETDLSRISWLLRPPYLDPDPEDDSVDEPENDPVEEAPDAG